MSDVLQKVRRSPDAIRSGQPRWTQLLEPVGKFVGAVFDREPILLDGIGPWESPNFALPGHEIGAVVTLPDPVYPGQHQHVMAVHEAVGPQGIVRFATTDLTAGVCGFGILE